MKRYRDYKNTVEYAEEKGIKKGIEQGKLEMALAMKRKGIPLEVIAECSGLSLEDIERL